MHSLYNPAWLRLVRGVGPKGVGLRRSGVARFGGGRLNLTGRCRGVEGLGMTAMTIATSSRGDSTRAI